MTITDPRSTDFGATRAAFETELGDRKSFSLIVDARTRTEAIATGGDRTIVQTMEYMKGRGLIRSAVIVPNAKLAFGIRQLAFSTGVYEWERYIDASSDADWEQTALAWIENGLDPDVGSDQ